MYVPVLMTHKQGRNGRQSGNRTSNQSHVKCTKHMSHMSCPHNTCLMPVPQEKAERPNVHVFNPQCARVRVRQQTR